MAVGVRRRCSRPSISSAAAIPVLAVYGVLLGLVHSRADSIVPGAVAHALNNAVAIALAIALA